LTLPAMRITMCMHIRWTEPAMKSERVTLLTSPEFKTFLTAEAKREGISVAELVRTRCEGRPSEEDAVLASLTAELHRAVADAKRSLKGGLDEARAVLADLRAGRPGAAAVVAVARVAPARTARKVAGKR
jgi:hypothetical protein